MLYVFKFPFDFLLIVFLSRHWIFFLVIDAAAIWWTGIILRYLVDINSLHLKSFIYHHIVLFLVLSSWGQVLERSILF